MRVWLRVGGILVVVLTAAAALLLSPRVQQWLYERGAAQATSLDNSGLLEDDAQGADVLVSEAIARSMVRTLETSSNQVGNERRATIMRDIQSYHIAPEEAADIANEAGVKLLVFYHLLPAPDAFLTRRLFGRSVADVRKDGWTIAEDGSLYTLPLGSGEVRIGKVRH